MYVRDAKNRDEVWLLDNIESMGLDDEAFRSRDYVIAVDETTNERAGFGRLRIHPGEPSVCELTGIGVLERWRGQGVGAHVLERLVTKAHDESFETIYVLTDEPDYLTQFGFEPIDRSALPDRLAERLDRKRDSIGETVRPLRLEGDFEMPDRLREAFKTAAPREEPDPDDRDRAEDFGIDPDSATYKYDTGR